MKKTIFVPIKPDTILNMLEGTYLAMLYQHLKQIFYKKNINKSYSVLGTLLLIWFPMYYIINVFLDGALDLQYLKYTSDIFVIVDVIILTFTFTTLYLNYKSKYRKYKMLVYSLSSAVLLWMSFYFPVDLSFKSPLDYFDIHIWRGFFAIVNPLLFSYAAFCLCLKKKDYL